MKYKNAICVFHLKDNCNIISGVTSKNPNYYNNCKENNLEGKFTLIAEGNSYNELSTML